MAETAAPVRGTRPEGARSEAEASEKVREMFLEIAPRYDMLNHLLSFELDRVWRRRAARHLGPVFHHPGTRVLDLCCGTGDLAIELQRRYSTSLVGVDFAHTMLVRAEEKCRRFSPGGFGPSTPIRFVEADALRLPFLDAAFDLVTTAFGFRNLANYEAGLDEIKRVLKPGGTVAILEFAEPREGAWGRFYRWYFSRVLPRVGRLVSGHRSAYTYLPQSVARFFRTSELAGLLTSVGYQAVEFQEWTMHTVALHTARKPGTTRPG